MDQQYGWALIPPLIDDYHLTATERRGRGLNYQHGRATSACTQDCLCLQNEHVSDLLFHSCFSFAGLCPPMEKRLLRLRAHSSTWILLHHSSHPSGQDETTHPLLWRYSRGTMVDKHSTYFTRIVLDFCPYEILALGNDTRKDQTHCWRVRGLVSLVQLLPTLLPRNPKQRYRFQP